MLLLTKRKREKLLRILRYMNAITKTLNISYKNRMELQKCYRESLFILKALERK